jgi:ABC-type polysaccharide/polyol phosphate transport system ATPase subunit
LSARPPAIRVEHLTKRFRRYRPHAAATLKTAVVDWARHIGRRTSRLDDPNRFDVLRDVSFEVAPGETIGLIGRNGAGKSTLLKTIAGIYRPEAGRVTVTGRLAALIELGAGFHPDFTGRENVLINGIILGLGRREVAERFERIVAFAELEDFMDAPVRTYSSGMFMRLAFSVAIHVDPDVLLVDEVLSVGDEAFQHKCRAVIEARVRSRRQATVIVSHDMAAIEALCQRVALIDPPRVLLHDRPARAVEDYRRLLAGSPA